MSIEIQDKKTKKQWKDLAQHLFEKLETEHILEHDYIMNTIDKFVDDLNINEHFTGLVLTSSLVIRFEDGLYRENGPSIYDPQGIKIHLVGGKISTYQNESNKKKRVHTIFYKDGKLHRFIKNKIAPAISIVDLKTYENVFERYFIDGVEYAAKDLKYLGNFDGIKDFKSSGNISKKFSDVLNIMSHRFNFKDNEKARKTAEHFGIPVSQVNKIINDAELPAQDKMYYDIIDYFNDTNTNPLNFLTSRSPLIRTRGTSAIQPNTLAYQ